MKDVFEWIAEAENMHFAGHVAAIFILAVLTEFVAPIWTTFSYPALILLAAASFMWNYPVNAIKNHGLFSEYLIELRLLWLVVIGLAFEYLAFGLFENTAKVNLLLGIAGFVLGLLVVFFSRSRLQERIAEARGFK